MESKNKFNPHHPKHAEEYSQIKDMTGREIIAYIKENTGVAIDIPLKDKKKIIKVAIAVLKRNTITITKDQLNNSLQVIDIKEWSKSKLIDYAECLWKTKLDGGWNIIAFFTPLSTIQQRFIKCANDRGIYVER